MSFMTKIEGVADTDEALPGMAFFAGTGPAGKTCGSCKHRGLVREIGFYHKLYCTTQCQMYKKLSGHHGAAVKSEYDACKYYEPKK